MSLDLHLFDLINGLAGRFPWLDAFGKGLAVFGLLAVILLALGFLCSPNLLKEERLQVMKTTALSMIGCLLLFGLEWLAVRYVFHHDLRSRPVNAHWATLLISAESHFSFPAWPALISTAVSIPLLRDRRVGIIALGVSTLIGVSLVFCGINFPADVLTGCLLGVGIGLTARAVITKRPSWRSLIVLWLGICLWGGMLVAIFTPVNAEGEAVAGDSDPAIMVVAPDGLQQDLKTITATGKVKISAASNGHLLVGQVTIVLPDEHTSLPRVQSLARQAVNASFRNWKKLSLLTVEIAEEQRQGNRIRLATLYTATIDRSQWPAGGFAAGQAMPGKKFYHARFYAPPASTGTSRL